MTGWANQPLNIIVKAATQFFEDMLQVQQKKKGGGSLKSVTPDFQLESLEK